MARTPFKMKGFSGFGNESPLKTELDPHLKKKRLEKNQSKVFGPKKNVSTTKLDSLQRKANEILISNKPNPNRKKQVDDASKAHSEEFKKVQANERYNRSRKAYIKRTHDIINSGKKKK